MKGKLRIYEPNDAITAPPEEREIGAEVERAQLAEFMLVTLRDLLDDDIEQVPMFTSIEVAGRIVRCVAFCPEHGKINRLPVNRRATLLWREALRRRGREPLDLGPAWAIDLLVGTVVVVTGDTQFMAVL